MGHRNTFKFSSVFFFFGGGGISKLQKKFNPSEKNQNMKKQNHLKSLTEYKCQF